MIFKNYLLRIVQTGSHEHAVLSYLSSNSGVMKSSVLDRDLADLVLNKSERLRIFLGVITDAHENLRRITLKSFLKKFSATEYCRHSGSTSVVFREMVDVLREHTSCKEVQAWVAEAEPLLPHSKEKLRKRIEFHKREVKRLTRLLNEGSLLR